MASEFGRTVSFSREQIATIPPEATERLVIATRSLLAQHNFPASLELGSDRPLPPRGGIPVRQFVALDLGVHGLYQVTASMFGSTRTAGRPVINRAVYYYLADAPTLVPDDIGQLQRGVSSKDIHNENLLHPQNVMAELGQSVMKLVDDKDLLPYEYWLVGDRSA